MEMEQTIAAWTKATIRSGDLMDAELKTAALLEVLESSSELYNNVIDFRTRMKTEQENGTINHEAKLKALEELVNGRIAINRETYNASKAKTEPIKVEVIATGLAGTADEEKRNTQGK